jgi:hypothetical protein
MNLLTLAVAVESDLETRLPIGVAAPPILVFEAGKPSNCDQEQDEARPIAANRGGKSHEVAEIHQAFRQHHCEMAPGRVVRACACIVDMQSVISEGHLSHGRSLQPSAHRKPSSRHSQLYPPQVQYAESLAPVRKLFR